jgi:transcription elongation factor Elf1
MTALKPCPFCNMEELIVTTIDCEDREGIPMAIRCGECSAMGPSQYVDPNEAKLIQDVSDLPVSMKVVWNTRF